MKQSILIVLLLVLLLVSSWSFSSLAQTPNEAIVKILNGPVEGIGKIREQNKKITKKKRMHSNIF